MDVSFWDRLIPGRQQRLIQAQEQSLQQWESELEAWKQQCLQIDKAYEQRLQQYERQIATSGLRTKQTFVMSHQKYLISAPFLQKAAVKAPYYQKKANLVASRGG